MALLPFQTRSVKTAQLTSSREVGELLALVVLSINVVVQVEVEHGHFRIAANTPIGSAPANWR
jgi:hypothetical protein